MRREYIHTPGGRGTFDPIWYRCLLPPDELAPLQFGKVRPVTGSIDGKFESLTSIELWPRGLDPISGGGRLVAGSRTWLRLVVDVDGTLVGRVPRENWGQLDLPDPSVFHLGELPRPDPPGDP